MEAVSGGCEQDLAANIRDASEGVYYCQWFIF